MHNIIDDYLTRLGFSQEVAKLYRVLVAKGPMTILETARASEIERTALYRLIESLTQRGLIEEVLEHKSRKIKAAEPLKIKLMVENEKLRAQELEESFVAFERAVEEMPEIKSTQVKYYRGVSGIKQILWNETRAINEAVGYTHRNLEEIVGVKYFAQYARELERKSVNFRDLRSDSFLDSTEESYYVADPIMTGSWRYLPKKMMNLTHNMDIYNDTIAMYYWENGDIFGLEIQNKNMAEMQRSIFETLWKLAEGIKLPSKYKNVFGDNVNYGE